MRTRIKAPQTGGVVERFIGTLKYEHLYRGYIGDGDALDMEVHPFRIIYNTIRPHQTLNDHTPKQAYPAQPHQPKKPARFLTQDKWPPTQSTRANPACG